VNAWVWTLASVLFISLLSLLGALFLLVKASTLQRLLIPLVGLAAGALLGDAFLHLLPEASKTLASPVLVSGLVLSGILMFFALEKFVYWRHCHEPASAHHPHPLTTMNLVGEGVHNFLDGVLVAASFLVSTHLGLLTTLAVVLHEIPHELGDFGVLVHGGLAPKKALLLNLAIGLLALLGALVTLALGMRVQGLANHLVPVAAGGFIYIACSDLIPELNHESNTLRSAIQLVTVLLGIGMMGLLLLGE
jgi:zinc and cadmium transporter